MRHHHPILLAFLLTILLPCAALADLGEDVQTMQDIEKAARRKSLALLVVLKNMDPVLTEGVATVPMARVISPTCEFTETRDPASRVLHTGIINDLYPVLDKDDDRVKLDLGERRAGWTAETNLQLFEVEQPRDELAYQGVEPQLLRRYADVATDLLQGLDEDRERADELLARHAKNPDKEELVSLHAKVVELHTQAHYFHRKYIAAYDFSMANRKRFLDNLSAWGEFLLGKSTFSTTTAISEDTDLEEEQKDTLLQLSLGGDLALNQHSRLRASAAKKKELNQTPYATTGANVGFNHQLNAGTNLDVFLDTYSYADEVNEFNDFRRNTLALKSRLERGTADYRLGYTLTGQSFSEHETDDFTSHSLDALADWDRGPGRKLRARLDSRFQSSDAATHKFNHITPSLEWIRGDSRARTRLRGLFESLKYDEASTRSFQRANLSWEKTGSEGLRRRSTRLSATHKAFPDNELSTYVQVKAVWTRNTAGARNRRSQFNTYTNFHLNNEDNNFTDLRLGRARGNGYFFSDINLYSRLWHKPGDVDEPAGAKPYVLDLFGRLGWERGPLRFGPTVGLHMVARKGQTEVWKQDGNLVRVGAAVDGSFTLARSVRLTLNASYDYGFVYSDQIAVDGGGNFTVGEVLERHPTTLQVSAFLSAPLNRNLDLTSRLMVYRIDTDMTAETSINPVTNNNRFSLFVGVRYHHN